ncbi:MAG: hypothetical protein J4F28_04400 [Nitrosopumilaceae archaeon]|nr:hypothetical protein [Nitrosopumilaceae archaeon]
MSNAEEATLRRDLQGAHGRIDRLEDAPAALLGARTGRGFGGKLEHAPTPGLLTSVNCLEVDPANNESEWMPRKAAISQKIRFRIASSGGGGRFSGRLTAM